LHDFRTEYGFAAASAVIFLKSLQAGENASEGKRRRAAAIQDLSDISTAHWCARSVVECASPLALLAGEKINSEDKGMTEF
jgi:hypothetical protein